MASLKELKKTRLQKRNRFLTHGIDPYPARTKRTCTIKQVLENFSTWQKSKKQLFLTGRILAKRTHGNLTFFEINDGSATIQVFFAKDQYKDDYLFWRENLDLGDFIEVGGKLIKTKTKQKTILASKIRILTKSLRPIPESWYGLKDKEERFRRRYLDILLNPKVRERFEERSKIISNIRYLLEKDGFLEVETPLLHAVAGGALAKPFKTKLNALNLNLFLRIAPELYLKRLLVAGFEKVYELGKNFRNEGMDREHNPEFTMVELYAAYKDYLWLMTWVEKFLRNLLKATLGKTTLIYQGQKINFRGKFARVEFTTLVERQTKIKLKKATKNDLLKVVQRKKVKIDPHQNFWAIVDEIFKKICRPKIIQPTFIINHPVAISPLAKKLPADPEKTERFQLIVGGMEIMNAFSELNDPLDQKQRFEQQQRLKKQGGGEFHEFDQDFIEALEYGMPPAAGLGIGVDRLVMILTDAPHLREVILFPTMRPKK